MKKLFIPIVLIAVFFAFYTPKEHHYAIYIKVVAIVILMIGVMKLMQKVPSRNQEKEDDEI
ncbi:hypothetical protein EQG68_11385 [Flavobacterium piscinae]|uniref:Uncharacterized protein n=1 Tax=Flavobacterium piscinae TaxID=2506424 RepID=A0A4Q1KL66_9FLAO|nr:hypothetical protein [Flavobacterium piscinae]RXR30653.1 hypothetical protein EQG68_11385 [Flavobacterium piscinae]